MLTFKAGILALWWWIGLYLLSGRLAFWLELPGCTPLGGPWGWSVVAFTLVLNLALTLWGAPRWLNWLTGGIGALPVGLLAGGILNLNDLPDRLSLRWGSLRVDYPRGVHLEAWAKTWAQIFQAAGVTPPPGEEVIPQVGATLEATRAAATAAAEHLLEQLRNPVVVAPPVEDDHAILWYLLGQFIFVVGAFIFAYTIAPGSPPPGSPPGGGSSLPGSPSTPGSPGSQNSDDAWAAWSSKAYRDEVARLLSFSPSPGSSPGTTPPSSPDPERMPPSREEYEALSQEWEALKRATPSREELTALEGRVTAHLDNQLDAMHEGLQEQTRTAIANFDKPVKEIIREINLPTRGEFSQLGHKFVSKDQLDSRIVFYLKTRPRPPAGVTPTELTETLEKYTPRGETEARFNRLREQIKTKMDLYDECHAHADRKMREHDQDYNKSAEAITWLFEKVAALEKALKNKLP